MDPFKHVTKFQQIHLTMELNFNK